MNNFVEDGFEEYLKGAGLVDAPKDLRRVLRWAFTMGASSTVIEITHDGTRAPSGQKCNETAIVVASEMRMVLSDLMERTTPIGSN